MLGEQFPPKVTFCFNREIIDQAVLVMGRCPWHILFYLSSFIPADAWVKLQTDKKGGVDGSYGVVRGGACPNEL